MELFRLLGTIAVNNSDANQAIDETNNRANSAGGKISTAFQKIGDAAVKMGAATITAVGTVATGIGALAKKSVTAYADTEQLIGGVETLFGNTFSSMEEYAEKLGVPLEYAQQRWEVYVDRQSEVLENASNAYKTAGMSANEYMETVTGFAASLNASLGEYAHLSARYSNMIVTDMSDNANKMGTEIESIKNAYAGFSKGNFTMLDNLKLGYGGTKEEMERLLRKAEELEGYKFGAFDINSFADVSEAIHIIQEDLGISGTTAKEAASTISGSIATMKGAWTNFIAGMADSNSDIKLLMNNLVDSVITVVNNIAPRFIETVPRLVEGLMSVAEKLIPYIAPMIDKLLPPLIEGATRMVMYLVQNLPSLIVTLGTALWNALQSMLSEIYNLLPGPVQNLFSVFSENGAYAVEKLSPVFENIKNVFLSVKDAIQPLIESFKNYASSGKMVETISNGIKVAIDVVAVACQVLNGLIGAVVDGVITAVNWCSKHQTIIQILAIAIGTLTTAILAYNAAMAIKNAGGIVELAQLGVLTIQLGALTVAETLHTAATTVATAATTAFGVAVSFLTSPITLVVLAIGGLIAVGVLLYKNWDTIKEKASELKEKVSTKFSEMKESASNKMESLKTSVSQKWDDMKDSIANSKLGQATGVVFDAMKQTATEKLKNILNAYVEHGGGVKGAVASTVEAYKSIHTAGLTFIDKLTGGKLTEIKNKFTQKLDETKTNVHENLENIKNKFTQKLDETKTKVSEAFETIKNVFKVSIMFIGSLINLAKDIILIPWNFIWQNFGDEITEIWNSIINYISDKIQFFVSIFDRIANIVKEKLSTIKAFLKSMIEQIISVILDKINGQIAFIVARLTAILEVVKTVWNAIVTYVSAKITALLNTISTVMNAIKTAFTNIWNAIVSFIQSVWNKIVTYVTAKITALLNTISTVMNAIKTAFTTIWNAIISAVIAIVTKMLDETQKLFNKIKDTIGNILTAMYTKITEIWNTIKTTVSNLVNAITKVISEKFNESKNTADKVFQNIKDSITKKIEAARDAVKNAIDKIKSFFNFEWKLPDIKLPHFSIEGKFSLNPPEVPKFGIEWYAKAMNNPMIMNSPTAFGINAYGQIMAGGEAGSEVVSGTDTLMNMISTVVSAQNQQMEELLSKIMKIMLQYLPQMSSMQVVLDSGATIGQLAPGMDDAIGKLADRRKRGVR